MARKLKKFDFTFSLTDWRFGAFKDLAVVNVYRLGPLGLLVYKRLGTDI